MPSPIVFAQNEAMTEVLEKEVPKIKVEKKFKWNELSDFEKKFIVNMLMKQAERYKTY